MFTLLFWKDVLERAIKTFAQAAVAALTADRIGLLDVDWAQMASVAGLAALVSVLTSIASAGAGVKGTASLMPKPKPRETVASTADVADLFPGAAVAATAAPLPPAENVADASGIVVEDEPVFRYGADKPGA